MGLAVYAAACGQVSFATGASGGGLIVGLFAAGMSPRDMGRMVVKFRRSDFWDPIGFGGVLRGQKFEVGLVGVRRHWLLGGVR